MVTLCNLLFHVKSTLNSDQLAQDFSSWILKISKDRNAKILLGILSQCLTVLISLLWIGGSNLCFHSPTVHLSMKTGSIFPIISSGKLKLPLYPPKPTADGIQHSIFRPSYFVTEDKPIDQAWFILGTPGSSQSPSVLSYATSGFLHDPSTEGRNEADQSVALLLVLLALSEDCLSPVFGISPALMAFERWQNAALWRPCQLLAPLNALHLGPRTDQGSNPASILFHNL